MLKSLKFKEFKATFVTHWELLTASPVWKLCIDRTSRLCGNTGKLGSPSPPPWNCLPRSMGIAGILRHLLRRDEFRFRFCKWQHDGQLPCSCVADSEVEECIDPKEENIKHQEATWVELSERKLSVNPISNQVSTEVSLTTSLYPLAFCLQQTVMTMNIHCTSLYIVVHHCTAIYCIHDHRWS